LCALRTTKASPTLNIEPVTAQILLRESRAAALWMAEDARAAVHLVAVRIRLGLIGDTRRQFTNKNPRFTGAFEERMNGLEPSTFCMASISRNGA
jgi:hypothetical protein